MEDNNTHETVRQERVQIEIPTEATLPAYAKEVVKDRVAVIHEDTKIVSLVEYTEAMKERPFRSAGAVKLLSLTQFVNFVKYMGGKPPVFVTDSSAGAVFNFRDENGERGWGDDTAEYRLLRTPEWNAWNRASDSNMGQSEFCDFLEDNMGDVVIPNGADLLALISDFRQLTKVEYGSAYRTQDGQVQLEYKEEKTNTSREMQLPAEFTLQLPVVQGAEDITTYQIKARLKYRVDKDSHKLIFRFTLIRPDIPERNARQDVTERLRELLGEHADVFEGLVEYMPKHKLLQRC